MRNSIAVLLLTAIAFSVSSAPVSSAQTATAAKPPATKPANVYPMQEGYVDSHGALIYYMSVGHGAPLLIAHGGPGASHDYFLPYLLPLMRTNCLIFIDERGSGKSSKLEDTSQYNIDNMADDIETVRQALGLGKISLLGHSFGGGASAGLCAQVSEKSFAFDSGQHLPQYERTQ